MKKEKGKNAHLAGYVTEVFHVLYTAFVGKNQGGERLLRPQQLLLLLLASCHKQLVEEQAVAEDLAVVFELWHWQF